MSEYQYYEFLAIDRPLGERERQELRAVSSRAVITATRFTNHYEWGSFKGDPRAWMERYFDAFLYFANWGTREFALRLPRGVLDAATARLYCGGEAASTRVEGGYVILEFLSEDEDGDWNEGEEDGLSSLVPLRADIAGGDLRTLYLGWLLRAQAGDLDDADPEPPCPPGLGRLNAALDAFAAFLRIDRDLLEAAAAGSPDVEETLPAGEVERWLAGLPEAEKTALLVRLVGGDGPALRAELVRRDVREDVRVRVLLRVDDVVDAGEVALDLRDDEVVVFVALLVELALEAVEHVVRRGDTGSGRRLGGRDGPVAGTAQEDHRALARVDAGGDQVGHEIVVVLAGAVVPLHEHHLTAEAAEVRHADPAPLGVGPTVHQHRVGVLAEQPPALLGRDVSCIAHARECPTASRVRANRPSSPRPRG